MPKTQPSGTEPSKVKKDNGRKGRKNHGGIFPKYLQTFCECIFQGYNVRQAAIESGKAGWAGYYFLKREDVQKRLKEMEETYASESITRTVDDVAARDQWYNDQLDEIAANGEGKNCRGRLKATALYFQVTHQIYTPDPSRLAYLQRIKTQTIEGNYSAPKPYEAQRFKALRADGTYESEHLKLTPAKEDQPNG